ncbi:MAG: hypothetical protein ACOC91_03195 [bacterium]
MWKAVSLGKALPWLLVAYAVTFAAGTAAGWYGHWKWTQAETAERLREARREAERVTRKQVRAEYEEQLQQERDARLAATARAALARRNYADCPAVPGAFGRVLNAIGTPGPSAPESAGEVSGEARPPGD